MAPWLDYILNISYIISRTAPWVDYILNIKSINFALLVLWDPGRPWELWQDHLWVVTSTMLIVYSALRYAILWILQSVHLLGLSWIEHLLQEVEQCDETEVSLVVALSASWLLLNTCEYLQRTPNTISHKSVHTCEAQSEIEGLAESCSTCILKTTSFQTKKRKKMITIQKSLQHASRGYQQWRVIGMLCSWYNVFFSVSDHLFSPQEHILQSFENVAGPTEHCDAVVTRLCGRYGPLLGPGTRNSNTVQKQYSMPT